MLRFSQLRAALERLGFAGTAQLLISRRRLRRFQSPTARLRINSYPFPLHFRRVATDKYVIGDVILERQYDCLTGIPDVRTIVDAGANIGATSVFLLNAYPRATLVALEPDQDNFDLLRRNLNYYGTRAVAIRRALWYRPERLVVDRGNFRDGGEWSYQVKPGPAAVADVEGITIRQLMEEHDLSTIDILKIDIEGAERYVMEHSASCCLGAVRTLAIELHDPVSEALFLEAVAPFGGRLSQHGEVTLWQCR